MRIVLDTNVLLSAFVFRRTCADLFEHCVSGHRLVTSRYILKEFREHLVSTFGFSRRAAAARSGLVAERSRIVKPLPVPRGACRDEDDLPVLGTALAGACRCIVTGDRDLLCLGTYEDVVIVSPGGFWEFEQRHRTGRG